MLVDIRTLYRPAGMIAEVNHADVAVFCAGCTNLPGDNVFYQQHVFDRSPSSRIPNIFFRTNTKPIMTKYRFVKTVEYASGAFPMFIERYYACDKVGNMMLFKVVYVSNTGKRSTIFTGPLFRLHHDVFGSMGEVVGLENPVRRLIKDTLVNPKYQKPSVSTSLDMGDIRDHICPDIWESDVAINNLATTVSWINLVTQKSDDMFYNFFLTNFDTQTKEQARTLQSDRESVHDSCMITTLQKKMNFLSRAIFDTTNPPPMGFRLTNNRVLNTPPRNFGIAKAIWELQATDFQCQMKIDVSTQRNAELNPFFLDYIVNRYSGHITWNMNEDTTRLRQICANICSWWIFPFLKNPTNPITRCTITVQKSFNEEACILVNTPDPRFNFCIYFDFVALSLGTYGASLKINQSFMDAELVM